MRRITAFVACAVLACAAALPAAAEAPTKDGKLGVYLPYGSNRENIRIDKIARVAHIDGGVYAKDQDPGDGSTGYLIFSLSVQNASTVEEFMPSFYVHILMDDQSDVSNDIMGPFVGAAKAEAPGRLQPKQSIKLTFIVFGIPADRKITKILLDPNDGGAHYRFQIGAGDIVSVAEIPRPPAE